MLFIATPLHENKVTIQYLHGLIQTSNLLRMHGMAAMYSFEQSAYIAVNREKLVRKFLKTNCLYLLFIDTDMSFSAQDVLSLLAADVQVVSALYRYRTHVSPGGIVHCFRDVHGKPIDTNSTELQECGFLPTGMLLIRRDVFERMYEQHEHIFDQGFRDTTWFKDLSEIEDGVQEGFEGEDICFSRLWRTMGGKLYVKTDVKVGHIETHNSTEF